MNASTARVRSTSVLISIVAHLLILGIFGLWHISVPRLPEQWITVTFETYRAKEKGKPSVPGQARKIKEISPKAVLPEEELLKKRQEELAKEERAIETALFGNKNLGVKIEGLLAKREVLRVQLPPRMPLLRDIAVQFRVRVNPQGEIIGIEVLKKGPPEVERAALEALRQWKFSPLPKSVQGIQDGVITFLFRVSGSSP